MIYTYDKFIEILDKIYYGYKYGKRADRKERKNKEYYTDDVYFDF